MAEARVKAARRALVCTGSMVSLVAELQAQTMPLMMAVMMGLCQASDILLRLMYHSRSLRLHLETRSMAKGGAVQQ